MKTTTKTAGWTVTDSNTVSGWTCQILRAWGTDVAECTDRAEAKRMAKRIAREDNRETAVVFVK